ncbi:MAG: prepilin-type N-terminal cleavage/methylation domain-containing protein [Elusimicrobiota bacterium]|nr:prepilin-type N-terminal cleavage/methylation domain-containing protein [Elusimicrobiota bacterium]
MEKQKGFTLIELAIVIALMAILGYGIMKFFTNTYRTWWQTSQQIDAQQKARAAMDEMTRFIRQARPVTALVVGHQAGEDDDTMISFTDVSGRQFQYFQSGDSLQRVVGGVKTDLIPEDLTSIFFILDSTSSPTQVDISTLTVQTQVTGGQQGSISFPRKRIFLRNR